MAKVINRGKETIHVGGHVLGTGEHDLPGWECVQWHSKGGYQGAEDRERIWFSPACLQPQPELF